MKKITLFNLVLYVIWGKNEQKKSFREIQRLKNGKNKQHGCLQLT